MQSNQHEERALKAAAKSDDAPPAKPTVARGIVEVTLKSGEKRLRAQARVAGLKSQYDVFPRNALKQAVAWQRDTETEMAKLAASIKAGTPTGVVPPDMTLAEVFNKYVEIAPTKGMKLSPSVLAKFAKMAGHALLKDVKVAKVNLAVIRTYCESRRFVEKLVPSTVKNDYVRISQSISLMASWLGWGSYNPCDRVMRRELMKAKLIGKSVKRHRRPTGYEVDTLLADFSYRRINRPLSCPMAPMEDLIKFAMLSAFRRGEICEKLFWSELQEDGVTIWRKDPKSEITDGVHEGEREVFVPISEQAMEIIKRQPRKKGEDRVFPFNGPTVSNTFHDTCVRLHGIEQKKNADADVKVAASKLPFADLRFHDLRHEAISEMATRMTPNEAMAISGHKTVDAFMTYVDIEKRNAPGIRAKMVSMGIPTAAAPTPPTNVRPMHPRRAA